jgi:hypothetical protein
MESSEMLSLLKQSEAFDTHLVKQFQCMLYLSYLLVKFVPMQLYVILSPSVMVGRVYERRKRSRG